jgi:hypothetical protein
LCLSQETWHICIKFCDSYGLLPLACPQPSAWPPLTAEVRIGVLGCRAAEPGLLFGLSFVLDLAFAAQAHDSQKHPEAVIVTRVNKLAVLVEERVAVPSAHAISDCHRFKRHRAVGQGSGLVETNDINRGEGLQETWHICIFCAVSSE